MTYQEFIASIKKSLRHFEEVQDGDIEPEDNVDGDILLKDLLGYLEDGLAAHDDGISFD